MICCMTWERPLIKTETHDTALSIAKSKGLKVWRVYELAIGKLNNGGELNDT